MKTSDYGDILRELGFPKNPKSRSSQNRKKKRKKKGSQSIYDSIFDDRDSEYSEDDEDTGRDEDNIHVPKPRPPHFC